jgi:CRISPR-associated protein Csy2
MQNESCQLPALLVLPRIRVQNANAISSPLTWGFPSITAFTGLMTALARRLGGQAGIRFERVSVVCHDFEAQVSQGGYTRSFCLTRNPVLQNGNTAAIVEEGRVSVDITLVFKVQISTSLLDDTARTECAAKVADLLAGMRIAGGSVMPQLPGSKRKAPSAKLVLVPDDADERDKQFKRLSRQWLPGFALVSRDDLLQKRLNELSESKATAAPQLTLLDAWLDLSRINYRANRTMKIDEATGVSTKTVEWANDSRSGWLTPIPVGYAALAELHPPGKVACARDPALSFCFVESVYSIGQWLSPHRASNIDQLMWQAHYNPVTGLYRCMNDYQPPVTDIDINDGVAFID